LSWVDLGGEAVFASGESSWFYTTPRYLLLVLAFYGCDFLLPPPDTGNDKIYAGSEDDILVGGKGSDTLHGGTSSTKAIDTSDGIDIADYSNLPDSAGFFPGWPPIALVDIFQRWA